MHPTLITNTAFVTPRANHSILAHDARATGQCDGNTTGGTSTRVQRFSNKYQQKLFDVDGPEHFAPTASLHNLFTSLSARSN
jgi:hypothetical protein